MFLGFFDIRTMTKHSSKPFLSASREMYSFVQAVLRITLLLMAMSSSLDVFTHSSADNVESLTATPTCVSTIRDLRTYLTPTDNYLGNATITIINDTKERKRYLSNLKGHQEVNNICPGAAEYLSSQSGPAIFRVSVSDCRRPGYDPRSRHAVVYGVCNDSTTFCQFLVQVPHGMVVRAQVKPVFLACNRTWKMFFFDEWPLAQRDGQSRLLYCRRRLHEYYLSVSDQLYIVQYNSPLLQLRFDAVYYRLKVKHTSHFGGQITQCVPQGVTLGNRYLRHSLGVPYQHGVMTSLRNLTSCFGSINYMWKEKDRSSMKHRRISVPHTASVDIFLTAILKIHIFVDPVESLSDKICLKLLFSFHPESQVPHKLSSGLYNCSVHHYWRFQQHLDCNLKVECEDGRDEAGHCPFSSPACQGWVASNGKCYKRFTFNKQILPIAALDECQRQGLRAASIKTSEEFAVFQNNFQDGGSTQLMIGLLSGTDSISFMYRRFGRWSDNTLVYSANHMADSGRLTKHITYYRYKSLKNKLPWYPIKKVDSIICEKYVQRETALRNHSLDFHVVQPLSAGFEHTRLALFACAEGHVTHSFLSCDPKSRCGQAVCTFVNEKKNATDTLPVAQSPADMYMCSNDDMIPYSLVCDFRHDCQDGNDESFCQHPPCDSFTCSNGQCISLTSRCNDLSNCLDDSDESDCRLGFVKVSKTPKQRQQVLINLDGKGYFTQQPMDIGESCPHTHYRCRAELIYCLPVYTRCNGYNDCVYHEDETNCETAACPGFYRCRDSTVCVHADHMCDGWPQCPQRDDEWLCDMTCPAQCVCQGHAFLCPEPFSAHLFPQIRYLDGQGSGMTPTDLKSNTYIIYLSLAYCSIRFLSDIRLPNLQFLSLNNNQMANIIMDVFLTLEHLQVLSLQGNPILSLTSTASSLQQHALQSLDLSRTHLSEFDSHDLRQFSGLQFMNISFASIESIGLEGFQYIPGMKELDIRGNSINRFPENIFRGLSNLALVQSSDHRLCCKDILPVSVSPTKCFAPQHSLSSCENLLMSEAYNVLFWLVSIIATLGNVVCLVGLCVARPKQYRGCVIVFIASLQCADFCLGIYSSVIVAAQEVFRGQYAHYENKWTGNVICKMAGFLSLLSSEVSILIIFLLTLDHLFVLCLPLSQCTFSTRSAAVACGVSWLVGILLASMPSLPGLSHWAHCGRTALCSFVPYDKRCFRREVNFLNLILAFNCCVSVVVFVAQVIIYRTLPKHQVLLNSSKNPANLSVSLITKIAVTNAIAWFAITTSSVLSLADVAGSEKVNLFMALVVLPFNSTANPLLCLLHAVAYKRRIEQEERVLRVLKAKIKHAHRTTTEQKKGNCGV